MLDALVSPSASRLCSTMCSAFRSPTSPPFLDRSEAVAQQLASRARRRVPLAPEPDPRPRASATVVDAFFAASRDGDFDALLDSRSRRRTPDRRRRPARGGLAPSPRCGAVAPHTAAYSKLYPFVRPALVNGPAGAVVAPHGRVFSIMAFTSRPGRSPDRRSPLPGASRATRSQHPADCGQTLVISSALSAIPLAAACRCSLVSPPTAVRCVSRRRAPQSSARA